MSRSVTRSAGSRRDGAAARASLARRGHLAACVLAALCLQCASTISRDEPLDARLERSRRDAGLFVVAFGAEWCAPCRRMDEESWNDPWVTRWFDAHAQFARVDLDRDPDTAAKHGVTALPTVVAFRAGREFDRVQGYRTPGALLEWLDGVRRGVTEASRLAREHAARPGDSEAAFALAAARITAHEAEEAAHVLAPWWDPPLSSAVDVARLESLTALAAESDAARPAFVERLDALARRLDDDRALESWLRLASVLGEHERAARWFTALEDPVARKSALTAARTELWTSLRAAGRRDAIVHLVELTTPAAAFAANQAAIPAELRADPSVLAMLRAANRERLVDLEAGLAELGRSEDAARVRAARLELERP